jgi:hypothetical protein
MLNKYKWTLLLTTFTPSLLGTSVFLAGGGHGTFLFTKLSFPFGMLGTIFQNEITDFFKVVGLLQFTIYGLIIDKSRNEVKAVLIIFLIYLIFVGVVMKFSAWK